MEIGPAVTTSKKPPDVYYAGVYKDARPDIEALINRFNIRGKRILSIGSGFGAEENLFAEIGGNTVVCIEPDEFTATFHKARAVAGVEIHAMTFQSFLLTAPKAPFDVVYTSSPTDWMSTPPTRGMPQRYADVMDITTQNARFIARLYSTYFRKPVLRSSFLRQHLYDAFRKKGCSYFEYWITDNGRCATFVASRDAHASNQDIPLLGSRFAQPVGQMQMPPLRTPLFFESYFIVWYAMAAPKIASRLAQMRTFLFKILCVKYVLLAVLSQ